MRLAMITEETERMTKTMEMAASTDSASSADVIGIATHLIRNAARTARPSRICAKGRIAHVIWRLALNSAIIGGSFAIAVASRQDDAEGSSASADAQNRVYRNHSRRNVLNVRRRLFLNQRGALRQCVRQLRDLLRVHHQPRSSAHENARSSATNQQRPVGGIANASK